MTVSVPDCFGPGTGMGTLITVSVSHDRHFGPAINCSYHLGLIIAVKGFIICPTLLFQTLLGTCYIIGIIICQSILSGMYSAFNNDSTISFYITVCCTFMKCHNNNAEETVEHFIFVSCIYFCILYFVCKH